MAPPGSPTTSLDNALRKQFPILKRPPYLNHAGIAPWPRAAAEAAQAFAEENLREVASNYPQWIRR
ncbi:MAG: hypothetical protein PVG42_07435, partial [Lysobacterales bacterium]